MEIEVKAIIFVGISYVRREFIIYFGTKVHRAMGKEGMGVEGSADGIAVSGGMVMD